MRLKSDDILITFVPVLHLIDNSVCNINHFVLVVFTQYKRHSFISKKNSHKPFCVSWMKVGNKGKRIQVQPNPAAHGIGVAHNMVLRIGRNNRYIAALKFCQFSFHQGITASLITISNLETIMEMQHIDCSIFRIPVVYMHAYDWKFSGQLHRAKNSLPRFICSFLHLLCPFSL